MWIKFYDVSIQRNFPQHYSGDGEFGKKKFDFFFKFCSLAVNGNERVNYVCMEYAG